MSIEEFFKSIGESTDKDKSRILDGLGDSRDLWLDTWGNLYGIPPDKRFGAFLTALDVGYRMAKRDMETDRLDKLIS